MHPNQPYSDSEILYEYTHLEWIFYKTLNISMLSGAQEFQFIASYYVMVQFQYIVFNVHCISIDRYITIRADHYCFKLNNISSCTSKMASC